jgi:putative endonuclease
MNNKDTGFLGKNITAQYLTQNGFEILHRNGRYKHLEIDIIAFKDGILHIVEVKT